MLHQLPSLSIEAWSQKDTWALLYDHNGFKDGNDTEAWPENDFGKFLHDHNSFDEGNDQLSKSIEAAQTALDEYFPQASPRLAADRNSDVHYLSSDDTFGCASSRMSPSQWNFMHKTRNMGHLLGDPEKKKNDWFRFPWKAYDEKECTDPQSEWKRAWHGCNSEELEFIMYNGKLLLPDVPDDNDNHQTHGIYCYSDGIVNWHGRSIWWELQVDRAYGRDLRTKKCTNQQWIQDPRSVRLVALWLSKWVYAPQWRVQRNKGRSERRRCQRQRETQRKRTLATTTLETKSSLPTQTKSDRKRTLEITTLDTGNDHRHWNGQGYWKRSKMGA